MDVPALICPACKGRLEYQITLEMLDPPVGKIDTGYCSHCRRLFEHMRQTGTYEPTMWMPVCRACRQPVTWSAVRTVDGNELVEYTCRDHPDERWTWSRGIDSWVRG